MRHREWFPTLPKIGMSWGEDLYNRSMYAADVTKTSCQFAIARLRMPHVQFHGVSMQYLHEVALNRNFAFSDQEQLEEIRHAVATGARINQRERLKIADHYYLMVDPLYCATEGGHTKAMMALIEGGADIDLLFRYALSHDRTDALDICLVAEGPERLLSDPMIAWVKNSINPQRTGQHEVLQRMLYLKEHPNELPTVDSISEHASSFRFNLEKRQAARAHNGNSGKVGGETKVTPILPPNDTPAIDQLSDFTIDGCIKTGKAFARHSS